MKLSAKERQAAKWHALTAVSRHQPVPTPDSAKWQVGKCLVHVRLCGNGTLAGRNYWFDINPDILSGDYELWMCGTRGKFNLIPVVVLRKIHGDETSASAGKWHPEIMEIHIDTVTNEAFGFSNPGEKRDFSQFRQGLLTSEMDF